MGVLRTLCSGYTGWLLIMSKRIQALLLGITLAAGAWTLPAQAQGTRIAYVDINKVMEQSPQAISANKRLEKEFEPRSASLNNMRKDLRKLEERLSRDGLTMSESQLRNLELDIRSRKREIKRAQEDFREDLNLRRNDELRRIQKRTYEAIVALAKREKYDIIVGEIAIYASPSVDITEKVLKMLASESKGSR